MEPSYPKRKKQGEGVGEAEDSGGRQSGGQQSLSLCRDWYSVVWQSQVYDKKAPSRMASAQVALLALCSCTVCGKQWRQGKVVAQLTKRRKERPNEAYRGGKEQSGGTNKRPNGKQDNGRKVSEWVMSI